VITAEERVYDQLVEDFNRREAESYSPVHVINIDITDNAEEATLGAFQICDLCERLEKLEDLDDDIADTLEQFEKKIRRHVLHTVAFYWTCVGLCEFIMVALLIDNGSVVVV